MTNMELLSQTMFKPKETTLKETYETVEEEKIEKCSVYVNDFIDEYTSLTAKHYTEISPSFRRCSSPGTYYTNRYFKCSKINEIPFFNDPRFLNSSVNKSSDFLGKMKRRFSWSKTEKSEEMGSQKPNRRSTIQECSVTSNIDANSTDDGSESRNVNETVESKIKIKLGDKKSEEDNDMSDDMDFDDVSFNIEAAYPMMSGIRTRRGAVTSKETSSNYRLYNIVQKDNVKTYHLSNFK